MKIINHEVKGGITGNYTVLQHQDEVCSATQFINGNFRPLKHGAHANSAHELSRFFHSISLKGDMPNTDLRPLIVNAHPTLQAYALARSHTYRTSNFPSIPLSRWLGNGQRRLSQ